MPRPRKCRWVERRPVADFFTPRGAALETLQGVVLPVEGLEALRLVDAEGLDQTAAAALMGVSRPTFSRVLAEARTLVAKALVNGWGIRIDGGDYQVADPMAGDNPCPGRQGPGGRGGGGRGGGHGQGRRWRRSHPKEGD